MLAPRKMLAVIFLSLLSKMVIQSEGEEFFSLAGRAAFVRTFFTKAEEHFTRFA